MGFVAPVWVCCTWLGFLHLVGFVAPGWVCCSWLGLLHLVGFVAPGWVCCIWLELLDGNWLVGWSFGWSGIALGLVGLLWVSGSLLVWVGLLSVGGELDGMVQHCLWLIV